MNRLKNIEYNDSKFYNSSFSNNIRNIFNNLHKKKPSGDFVFQDLRMYALGIGCIICGVLYILDKLKII